MKKILFLSIVLAALVGCQQKEAPKPVAAPAAEAPAGTEMPAAAPAAPAAPAVDKK